MNDSRDECGCGRLALGAQSCLCHLTGSQTQDNLLWDIRDLRVCENHCVDQGLDRE